MSIPTTTPTTVVAHALPDRGRSPRTSALTVALETAHARLDAALHDLRTLIAAGELSQDVAQDLEREYVARHLHRVADLEERGALACTPGEWLQFATTAARRDAANARAAQRRHRARLRRTVRQCRVVAPGRIADPVIATLIDRDTDAEASEIRADLAAASLL